MKTLAKHISLALILISLLAPSCFIFKPHKSKVPTIDTTKIINLIQSSNLQFNTLKLKYSAVYIDANNEKSFSGYIKIHHDSIIKISVKSAFVNLANIYLSKDTIQIHSLFFENQGYNYKTFSKEYGVNLTYNILENMLVGNIFTYPPDTKLDNYKISLTDTLITLTYRKPAPQNIMLSSVRDQIIFSKTINKIVKHNIWDFNNSLIELYITYSEFRSVINAQKIPSKIDLQLINNSDTLKLFVNYNKISIQ